MSLAEDTRGDSYPLSWRELTPDGKAAIVRPLAAEGLSSSQIAARVSRTYGTVSRSAVLALCSRARIKLAGSGRGKPSAVRRLPVRAPEEEPRKVLKFPAAPSTGASFAADAGLSAERRADMSAKSLAPGGAVSFLDLGAHHCRWPVWGHVERPEAGGEYCGAWTAPGKRYCCGHALLSYKPAPARKNVHARRGREQ